MPGYNPDDQGLVNSNPSRTRSSACPPVERITSPPHHGPFAGAEVERGPSTRPNALGSGRDFEGRNREGRGMARSNRDGRNAWHYLTALVVASGIAPTSSRSQESPAAAGPLAGGAAPSDRGAARGGGAAPERAVRSPAQGVQELQQRLPRSPGRPRRRRDAAPPTPGGLPSSGAAPPAPSRARALRRPRPRRPERRDEPPARAAAPTAPTAPGSGSTPTRRPVRSGGDTTRGGGAGPGGAGDDRPARQGGGEPADQDHDRQRPPVRLRGRRVPAPVPRPDPGRAPELPRGRRPEPAQDPVLRPPPAVVFHRPGDQERRVLHRHQPRLRRARPARRVHQLQLRPPDPVPGRPDQDARPPTSITRSPKAT